MQIGKLFIGKRICNDDNRFILAAWEYRSGYWIWCLDWIKPKNIIYTLRLPIPKPSYDCGRKFFASKGRFACHITIPLIGCFSFSTQPIMKSMDN